MIKIEQSSVIDIRDLIGIPVNDEKGLVMGKVVDFIGSGYSDSLQIVSLGWLASIVGVTGIQMELEELKPISQDINPDNGLKETVKIVSKVKSKLSNYWKCFS